MESEAGQFESCITWHCGLCAFSFETEQNVVVEVSRGGNSSEEVKEVLHSLCSEDCSHPLGIVTGFHRDCYDVSKSASAWLSAVNEYDFDPFPKSSLIDGQFLRDRLTNVVARNYPLLPPELCHYTADYVAVEPYLRFCSISNALALKGLAQTGSQVIDLSCDVWATTIDVQNRTYCASLTNTKCGPAKDQEQALLYSPSSGKLADTIYVARDAWGIRTIQFAHSEEIYDIPESAGVWWQTLSIHGGQLVVKNDGIKLRTVHYSLNGKITNSFTNASKTWYSTPQPPSLRIWQLPSSSRPTRRTSVVLNNGDVKGIIVGLSPGSDTFCVRTHLSSEDFFLYHASEQRKLSIAWIYVPLERGERIREIWLRKNRNPSRRSALILVTSAGRTHVLAEHPPPGFESEYSYHLTAAVSQQPVTLFLGFNDEGYQDVAFSLPPPRAVDGRSLPSLPNLPSPASPFPRSIRYEHFFYSCAEVRHVSEVIPCRVDGNVKGIILNYLDGRVASLGQIRLDLLDKAETVSQYGLWFQVSPSAKGFPQVTDLRVNIPSPDVGSYFHIEWLGHLEWWSSRRQCQLRYNGTHCSMATKL